MTSYFRELINFTSSQSSGRFAFLFSVILSNIVVWYTWLFVCLWTRSMVDIPMGVVAAYGAANGISFLGKGLQSFAERTEETRATTAKSLMEVD